MTVLTRQGKEKVRLYLDGLKEKRKEILDVRKDTTDNTELPDEEAISSDIEWSEEEGIRCLAIRTARTAVDTVQ